MNKKWCLITITLAFIAATLFPGAAVWAASSTAPKNGVCASKKGVRTFKTNLQPGVWTSFELGASADTGAYLVDITPREPSLDGAYIQHAIRPEFDGREWVDVLRVWLPDNVPALKTTIDVRCRTDFPLYMNFDITLNPGDWQGYVVQNAQVVGGFVGEVSPLQPSVTGATVERYLVEPEQPWGVWHDVFRVVIPLADPPVSANLRLWGVHDMAPVVFETEATLYPGVWHGWALAPASDSSAYVVEVSPLESTIDGTTQRYWVQPEFNGSAWNDVLRVEAVLTNNPMPVNLKVYAIDMR